MWSSRIYPIWVRETSISVFKQSNLSEKVREKTKESYHLCKLKTFWWTKIWVSKRITYKTCILVISYFLNIFSVTVTSLSCVRFVFCALHKKLRNALLLSKLKPKVSLNSPIIKKKFLLLKIFKYRIFKILKIDFFQKFLLLDYSD